MPPEVTPSIPSTSLSNDISSVALNDDGIQIDDKIYSTKILASIHPGGDLFVKAFSGLDATEAFLSYHRRSFPHQKLESIALVGNTLSRKNLSADLDYLELCVEVEKILPKHKSFAPWHYFVKVFLLLSMSVGLELYIHYNRMYKWYLTGPLGLCFALIGMNIQHDANHGAISKYPIINKFLGYSQNWIGGSMVDWIHQHVVQHHVNTNDLHSDPDIVGNVILRLNPLRPLSKHHAFQHIYTFLIIAVFGITIIQYSFENVWKGFHHIRMSPYIGTYRNIDMFSTLVFVLRWFVLPLISVPSLYTYLNIAPMFVVGGYYLAFFFLISHNFDGVTMFDKSQGVNRDESFLYTQVVTSSNVGGSILCFFNGGLNYQIEHHLFPRIQHSHYPKIAPTVRAFCNKKNIPYVHFPTITDNFKACVKHLLALGTRLEPVAIVKSQ